jgi:hypothetical protein
MSATTKLATLSKAALLAAANQTKLEPLELPELGGTVYVKAMTAGEREQFEQDMTSNDLVKSKKVRATVFANSVTDENGNRLFTSDDIDSINSLPASIVSKVFDKSNEINGINTQQVIEQAEKN